MPSSLHMLLDLVDEAFDCKAWHGTTLLGSVRGVRLELASWRPAPRRHNIWEIAVHGAYWKYAVRRRLTGEKRGTFAFKGSNWFARPSVGQAGRAGQDRQVGLADWHGSRAWAGDVRLLIDEHRRLREAIASFPERALNRPLRGQRVVAAYLIRGIAAHDLYHAGQIQLLKRLYADGRS